MATIHLRGGSEGEWKVKVSKCAIYGIYKDGETDIQSTELDTRVSSSGEAVERGELIKEELG